MATSSDILDFWFQGLNDQKIISSKDPVARRWFIKDKKFDDEIRRRFEPDLISTSKGLYKDWETSSKGLLALIIMLDQFSRNLYRNTSKMYAFDALALELALRVVKEKKERELQLIERIFIYMPFQHAEELEIQQLSLKSFENLLSESKEKCPQSSDYYEYSLEYARRHYDIIKRFGRFPHRNAILGRKSTVEEKQFLKNPNSSF